MSKYQSATVQPQIGQNGTLATQMVRQPTPRVPKRLSIGQRSLAALCWTHAGTKHRAFGSVLIQSGGRCWLASSGSCGLFVFVGSGGNRVDLSRERFRADAGADDNKLFGARQEYGRLLHDRPGVGFVDQTHARTIGDAGSCARLFDAKAREHADCRRCLQLHGEANRVYRGQPRRVFWGWFPHALGRCGRSGMRGGVSGSHAPAHGIDERIRGSVGTSGNAWEARCPTQRERRERLGVAGFACSG